MVTQNKQKGFTSKLVQKLLQTLRDLIITGNKDQAIEVGLSHCKNVNIQMKAIGLHFQVSSVTVYCAAKGVSGKL